MVPRMTGPIFHLVDEESMDLSGEMKQVSSV